MSILQQSLSLPLQQLLSYILLLLTPLSAVASNRNNDVDYSMYGMSMQRDWLTDSRTISIKYLGCVWGYVDADNGENLGCMPNDSGDGTTYWYQMANCRRAQVAYGMYASSGYTSCNKRDFKESVSLFRKVHLAFFSLCRLSFTDCSSSFSFTVVRH